MNSGPVGNASPLLFWFYWIVQLWQCDEVQSFENMDIEFAINNPHYLSGFTITADLFQNTKGK